MTVEEIKNKLNLARQELKNIPLKNDIKINPQLQDLIYNAEKNIRAAFALIDSEQDDNSS